VTGVQTCALLFSDLEVLPISRIQTRYQITLEVTDQPGVLAQVANIFADHNVSIETVEQSAKMIEAESTAWLEIGTHQASDKSLAAVVSALRASAAVEQITSVIRVEGV
jgi:homoserine dehydrogenase